jgi:hypothetical protein
VVRAAPDTVSAGGRFTRGDADAVAVTEPDAVAEAVLEDLDDAELDDVDDAVLDADDVDEAVDEAVAVKVSDTSSILA